MREQAFSSTLSLCPFVGAEEETATRMLTQDDINYAIENTKIVLPPEKRIQTFETSVLNYYLVTEDMDQVNLTHVREGKIVAERPQIMSPHHFAKLALDGFGDKASEFAELISKHSEHFAILQYGFNLTKSDIRHYEVHEPMDEVLDRVLQEAKDKKDPLATVLSGIDDAWEVSLVKFTIELASASGEANFRELRRRGLL